MVKNDMHEVNGSFTLSVITAKKPRYLSKQFTLADNGTLQKHPGGMLAEGMVEVQRLDLAGFCSLLAALKPNQALCFGVPAHDKALIVPQKDVTHADQRHASCHCAGTASTSTGRTAAACSCWTTTRRKTAHRSPGTRF